ncbi:MAG: glycoside hydrolase family 3 C-terminal domain-containing protein [Eubacteriales bacterium]|nr:glycoside hydrolase family 3 C-terminal domain-containing protein [Eubacteriales bacterium]
MKMSKKVESLLKELTLDEKIAMIHGGALFATSGVERLGIPPLVTSDGPMGVRLEFEPNEWKPVGHSDDFITYLPCNSALAATWNRELARESGKVLGEEARGRGKDVILAPGINIKRSPLCGRNFEYFSEDPYLTQELCVPFIQGVQSADVATCVKHFAANNQETDRLTVDVDVEKDVLHEIYLKAFKAAVQEGDSYTIMGAYNKLYGRHCCHSDYLLDDVLRKDWGYDGVVISDWGGVHDTIEAANTSLDIEMSVFSNFDEYIMANPLKEKVQNGEVPESAIDEKVVRILNLMEKLHMLGGERKRGCYNTPAHREAALNVARESVVLLKNENQVLPLDINKLGKVLVVGENADVCHAFGGGSAELKVLYETTPLLGLKSHIGGNNQVIYTPGYCRDLDGVNPVDWRNIESEDVDKNWQESSLEGGGGSTMKEEQVDAMLAQRRVQLREEAVALAKECDTVIYVGGLNHFYDCEGSDRANMKLPYDQDVLIQELLAVKPDMVVVMMAGSQVEMTEWIEQAQAVVWTWYAGTEGGNALAEVLLGDVNPSGKMPDTMYKTHTDCSAHAIGEFKGGEKVTYKEGRFVGYRYNDKFDVAPLFPFGHGLSYTSFAYDDLQVNREQGVISCLVKNTGAVDGAETIQVYRSEPQTKDSLVKELAGFEKVFLKAGEEQKVTIAVENMTEDSNILVGASAGDIRLGIKGNG